MNVESRARMPDKETQGIELVELNPKELMEYDIAYTIVDPHRLLLGGSFLPPYYAKDRAQVLMVWNPRLGKPSLRTKDGHNRIAEAEKYMRTHPDYVLEGFDVTGITLKTNYPNRKENYLTEEQFYREIGEPTKAHDEIQFRRFAAHFLSDWSGLVGNDIAANFSGLAALHILGRNTYGIRSLNEVFTHQSIDASEMKIMGGEDEKIREKLKGGLKAMASRILITGLSYAEIAFAGFQLVTAAYEDIGMEAKEREIRGLLSREDIVSRFFPDGSERKRTRLGNLLIEAFQSITAPGEYETDQREDEIRAIINALSNKNLSYQQIMSVFDPSRDGTIRSQYSQVLSQQRKARATGRSARTKPRTTPPVEAARDDAPPPHEEAAREIGFDERVIISVEALEELLDQAKKDSLQLGGNARTALSRLAERVHIYRNSTESSQPLRSPISPRGAVPTPPGYEWAWKRDGTRGLVRILPDHTKKILSTLELARESNTRDKVVLPRLIQKYPTEIFSSQWAKHASCNGKEEIVDVEGAEENNAKELCRYCPVQHACLADNLEYGVNLLDDDHSSNTQNDILQANINFVRGGKTARERREMLKKKPTEVDTLIADVRDARAYQNRILHK